LVKVIQGDQNCSIRRGGAIKTTKEWKNKRKSDCSWLFFDAWLSNRGNNLTILHLGRNQINSNSFQGLENLEELNLEGN